MNIAIYLFLASTILGMNIFPLFMPPTWLVLAFFVNRYNLNIVPVVLIGASFATFGRIILASISHRFFRRFFSKESQENYASIGAYLNSHEQITIPLVVTYAFIPIPSNHIFIAAGLAKVRIKLLASAFFVGRLISYTFWVGLSQKLADNLEDIFSSHYSKIGTIGVELLGVLVLFIIGKIAWKKILKHVGK